MCIRDSGKGVRSFKEGMNNIENDIENSGTEKSNNENKYDHCHFLDLPFYETGKIQKNPISEADVEIVRNLLREVKPHQIFVAGDLSLIHI